VYIESKRLGEAIVNNLISKISHRYAIYRVALATPPMLLPNDNRVLSDLINSAISNGIVRLKGGAEFIRQYQYGPNAVYKMLGSLVNGSNNLYINAGSHVLTLGDLAQIISCIFNVPLVIDTMLHDHTAPPVVLLDTSRIDRESEYINSLECSFESYIRKIANAKT
jgi:nucleoside-diphosphate-sugar epimerase